MIRFEHHIFWTSIKTEELHSLTNFVFKNIVTRAATWAKPNPLTFKVILDNGSIRNSRGGAV